MKARLIRSALTNPQLHAICSVLYQYLRIGGALAYTTTRSNSRQWKNHDSDQKAFDKLLRDSKAEEK